MLWWTLLIALLLAIATPAVVAAQTTLKRTVSFESLFLNPPSWVVSVGLGASYLHKQRAGFGRLSLGFGYHATNWMLLGMQSDVRLARDTFWLTGFRWGLFYRRAAFSIEFVPAMIGIAWKPSTGEVGPVLSPILEFNISLGKKSRHALYISLQADLLFDKLGFKEDQVKANVTLGWRLFF